MKPSVQEILEEVLEKVQDEFGPELHSIMLFGSYAKGLERSTSDIDIAIIFSENRIFSNKKLSERNRIMDAITNDLSFPINIILESLKATNYGKAKYGKHMPLKDKIVLHIFYGSIQELKNRKEDNILIREIIKHSRILCQE